MSSSLGNVAHCDTLIARELGSRSRPVETIHTASTFLFQNDLSFKDGEQTKLVIQRDGHLSVSQDVHLYDSTDIETGKLCFSLGLSPDGSKFRIVNEQTGVTAFEVGDEGVAGEPSADLLAAINAKQAKLLVNGVELSGNVLDTFTLSPSPGDAYAKSLVTAGALEQFIENVLQPSIIGVSQGQAAGVRVGSIATPPSNVNVPSCSAVVSHVSSQVSDVQAWVRSQLSGYVTTQQLSTQLQVDNRVGFPPSNKSDSIWGILSADEGQASAGKALIPNSAGLISDLQGIGINTTTPTDRLHIVNGNILVTGGTINVGKNEDQTAHFGRGRISHFAITNPNTGAAGSSVSFSHHDCDAGTNFALLQTNTGETILNGGTGTPLEFRTGGLEKMRVHTNGFVGINQTAPIEALDVGGNVKATNITATAGVSARHVTALDASISGDSGLAKIHHTSQTDIEDAALCQDAHGNTFINAGKNSSQTRGRIYFTTGVNTGVSGDTRMIIMNNGNFGIGMGGNPNLEAKLHVGGSIKAASLEAGKDTDTTCYFGRAAIGTVGTTSRPNYWSDQASFAHIDMNTQQDFALKQDRLGYVTLNSPQRIDFTKPDANQTLVLKMRLTSAGDLGIGTPASGSKNNEGVEERLHVVGSMKATGSAKIGADVLAQGAIGNTVSGINGMSNYNLWNVNSALLTELKSFIARYGQRYNADGGEIWGSNVKFNVATSLSQNGGIALWNETFKMTAHAEYGISFRTGVGSPVERLQIHKDGNIGINTTAPTEKLHVVGNVKVSGVLEAHANSNDATAVSQIGFAKIGTNTWNNTVSFSHKDKHNTSSFGMRFGPEGHTVLNSAGGKYTQLTIGNSQAIHIGPNKNVRIGTTVSEPSHKLHVDGDIKATGNLGIGTNPTVKLDVAGDAKVSGSAVIGSTPSRRIGVGVGVTPPRGEKLRVNGDVKVYGNIAATVSVTGSDDRLKHNEEDISDSLTVIRKLKPQKYQKTKELKVADFNGPLEEDDILCVEAGFIAQDIQNVPELAYSVTGGDYTESIEDSEGVVTTNEVANPHYLNYNNILTYNVAATQELDALVTALLARVADLEARLSEA